MSFTERQFTIYKKQVKEYVEKRRPRPEIREKVDLSFRIEGQSITIFEIRRRFFDPKQKYESPIAKTTFVRNRKHWKVFWMRQDLKWHMYKPKPTVRSIAEFLRLVEEDSFCCFWG